MSYNSSIPLITDPYSQSYAQIRSNFIQINNSFAVNHAGLTQDQTISGKHDMLTLRPQGIDPATSASQTAFYNKFDGSGIPQIFFRPNNSQTPIQLTYQSVKADSTTTQYTFVAGPFLIYGGFIQGPITQNQLVTLTPGSSLIHVDLTMTNIKRISDTKMAIPTNIVGTSFNIVYTLQSGPFDLYYFAIGLP